MLAEPVKGALRLAAVSREALALGLRPGLALADARARIPHLTVVDHDPVADAALLARMAEACDRFTPRVALDPPDGLVLDMTGCLHLFGGEAALRVRVLRLFGHARFTARATLAGTPDSARALARFGRVAIVPEGDDARHVRPLPVAALGLADGARMALALAGLTRIADLADRPGAPLAARFGADLPTRLRRILGYEDRRITPLRPPPTFQAQRAFAEPITHQGAVEAILDDLVGEVADGLSAAERGGRAFEASFFRSDGAVRRIGIATGRPSRERNALLGLLRERLAALTDPLDPGYGFDLVRFAVHACEPLHPHQPGLARDDETVAGNTLDERALFDLIDRLVARLGPARVLRFTVVDTHDPLRAARLVPASAAAGAGWPAPEPGEPPARPLRLFGPPQPVEAVAEVPDGPPLRFRWRRVLHRVVHAEGPERIAAEWWRAPDCPTRDYYRVEDADGRRFWLFREGLYGSEAARPGWYLHGLFA